MYVQYVWLDTLLKMPGFQVKCHRIIDYKRNKTEEKNILYNVKKSIAASHNVHVSLRGYCKLKFFCELL